MERFEYEEVRLANDGYLPALQPLPMRDEGESADKWLDRCDQAVEDRLAGGTIDRDLAERALACAEILAAELRRYPGMVSWCHREYFGAADFGVHPDDEVGRYRAAAATVFECEDPGAALIDCTLFTLMAGDAVPYQ